MLTVTDISPRLIDSVNALNVILKDSNKASMLLGIFSLIVWLSPQSSPQWSPFLQNSICSFVSLSVLEYLWVHLSSFEYFWLFFYIVLGFEFVWSNFGIVMAFLWFAERPVSKLTLDIFKCGSTENGIYICECFERARKKAVLHDFQLSFAPREAESKETYEEQNKSHFLRQPPRFHACLALMLVEEYRRPSSNARAFTLW